MYVEIISLQNIAFKFNSILIVGVPQPIANAPTAAVGGPPPPPPPPQAPQQPAVALPAAAAVAAMPQPVVHVQQLAPALVARFGAPPGPFAVGVADSTESTESSVHVTVSTDTSTSAGV